MAQAASITADTGNLTSTLSPELHDAPDSAKLEAQPATVVDRRELPQPKLPRLQIANPTGIIDGIDDPYLTYSLQASGTTSNASNTTEHLSPPRVTSNQEVSPNSVPADEAIEIGKAILNLFSVVDSHDNAEYFHPLSYKIDNFHRPSHLPTTPFKSASPISPEDQLHALTGNAVPATLDGSNNWNAVTSAAQPTVLVAPLPTAFLGGCAVLLGILLAGLWRSRLR